MRFPLRLTADLAVGRAARATGLRRKFPLIFNLDADEDVPAESPVVWIGGSEPLECAETARVANALAAAGHYVFLSTDGILLRRRIHEFQPSARLYLTIRFDGTQQSHDRRASRAGAFHAALDGIRTAKLSGFLLCAHLILHEDGDVVELAMLRDELRKFNLDGFLILPSARSWELTHNVEDARGRLLSRRWAQLSRLLDPVALPSHALAASQISRGPVAELPQPACEEGAQSS
jgi:MoaA/NifB/PqqE/SkfB family radical SAM enzyme